MKIEIESSTVEDRPITSALTGPNIALNKQVTPQLAAAAPAAPVPGGMGQYTVEAGTANRPLWQGNLNVYWLFGTAVGLWFLFIYAPGHVSNHPTTGPTTPLVVHLASVYFVYLICMWNCYHTPSHGPHYCTAHVWLGRLAVLVLGPLGFLSGLYLSWNPQYSTARGLAIGLTSGGAAQMCGGAIGYFGIWKWRKAGAGGDGTEAEKEKQREFWMMVHMIGMITVFLPSCGTPALMRLAGSLGVPLGISLGVFIPVMSLLVRPMQQAIANKKMV